MPGNSNLHDSSRNKQDEFYTNLQLIEDELKHYRAHFKGKRVLCNCDDPYESNFFKFFAMSFNSLGLWSRARRPSSGTSAPSSNRTCRFPAYGFPCETVIADTSCMSAKSIPYA